MGRAGEVKPLFDMSKKDLSFLNISFFDTFICNQELPPWFKTPALCRRVTGTAHCRNRFQTLTKKCCAFTAKQQEKRDNFWCAVATYLPMCTVLPSCTRSPSLWFLLFRVGTWDIVPIGGFPIEIETKISKLNTYTYSLAVFIIYK